MIVRYDRPTALPQVEVATLEEARLWCRIEADDTTQDAILLKIIRMAREMAEDVCEQAFVLQTRERCMDGFPADGEPLYLRPPLVSADSVSYLSASSTVVIAGSPNVWEIGIGGEDSKAWIIPIASGTWPTADEGFGSVKVTYTTGYASSSLIPARAWLYVQSLISTFYGYREQIAAGSFSGLPREMYVGLLDGLRAKQFFA